MTPVYVIACDELPDRKAACVAHLTDRLGPVGFRVWRGIHGKTWGLETVREFDPGRRISPGHVGLNLGHWALWNHLWHAHPRPDQEFLVLEDDAVLPAGWAGALSAVRHDLEQAMPDWQFVHVGLAETEPHVWHKVIERVGGPASRLCRIDEPFGTHAYLVRRSALPALIDRMCVAERNMDQQLYRRVLKDNHVRWCSVLPTLIRQRTFDYVNAGKPEWAASTVDPDNPDGTGPVPVALRNMQITDRDVRRLVAAAAEMSPIPQSVRDEREGRPSPAVVAATAPYVDPVPCFYRGEFLDDHGRTAAGRTVPLALCARLNVPCHTKPSAATGVVTAPNGDRHTQPAVACDACKLRTELAANQSGTPGPRLPLPDGHFNPSMIVYDGKLILATRDSWGHSKVALWRLDNSRPDWTGEWAATPIGSYGSTHPDAPRLEDPRLFAHADRLHAAFNLPDGYPPKRVQVGYVRFAKDLSGVEHTHVYKSPGGRRYEKNWVPFDGPSGELRWVYDSKPDHAVMDAAGWVRPECTTPNPFPWTGGVIRGGATPVKMTDPRHGYVYYHFFHGCLKRLQGSVYSVGCLVFAADPPFRVLRQTPTPLVWPDPADNRDDVVKRFVVWPGGAVPHAGAWHLAVGVNDTYCRIVRLPFKQVEAALKDVPEPAPAAVGIMDSPMHTGVSAADPTR